MSFKEYKVKVYANGHKAWYRNGKFNREDGPAVEYANGHKAWYLDDNLHREDGPAVELANGGKCWYLNGIEYTEAEFKAKMAPAKEMTVGELEKLLGYRLKIVKE